jgi:hypothetical protein
MITNRTFLDVAEAKKIRASKIQKFVSLTEEELAIVEKGLVTLNTLNRIEQKQIELKETLANMGYYSGGVWNKYWHEGMYFTSEDLQRIVDNVAKLRNSFFVLSNTPNNPIAKFHYEEFNNIEKILVDIETMIADVIQNYRECNTFYCGEG